MRTERPFRVLGVQQIAVGARDKSALRRFWVDLLGLNPVGEFKSVAENVDEDILRVGPGAFAVEVDLMQPLDPEARPCVHEPALNHVGLWVDDLLAAVSWLSEAGVRFTARGIGPGASGHDVCFIHPKGDATSPIGAEGVLVELVQAPPELQAAFRSAQAEFIVGSLERQGGEEHLESLDLQGSPGDGHDLPGRGDQEGAG